LQPPSCNASPGEVPEVFFRDPDSLFLIVQSLRRYEGTAALTEDEAGAMEELPAKKESDLVSSVIQCAPGLSMSGSRFFNWD